MANFDIGETVICSCEVKDDAGVLKDPATSMQIQINQLTPQPASKIGATNMTKDAVGKYSYDFQTSTMTAGKYEATYTATDGLRITKAKDSFALE